MKLDEISIENFKAIDSLEFQPKMINILIGRNNTGKTSLLEAITLAFSDELIRQKFNGRRSKPSSIINYHGTTGYVSIKTSFGEQSEYLVNFGRPSKEDIISSLIENVKKDLKELEKLAERYHRSSGTLTRVKNNKGKTAEATTPLFTEDVFKSLLTPQKLQRVIEESLELTRNSLTRRFYGEQYRSLKRELINEVLSKLPKGKRETMEDLSHFFLERATLDYYVSDFNEHSEREQKKKPSANLPILISDPQLQIREIQNDKEINQTIAFRIEQIIKDDRLVPGLERFNFDSLVFADTKTDVQMESMGDGFKVLIGLIGSLMVQPDSSILLLEEPEVHMHPGYMRELTTYLVDFSRTHKIQLFISTHSIDLIQNFLEVDYLSKESQKFLKSELAVFRLSRTEAGTIIEEEGFKQAVENINELSIDLRGI